MQIAIGRPPRRRKTQTLFELQWIKSAKHRSPYDSSYKCTHGTIGFFASVELAEAAMAADVASDTESIKEKINTEWDRAFAYMIYERPIQTGGRKRQTWLWNPYDSIRSYDGFGRPICVHDYDDGDSTTYTKPFVGRDPLTIRFHHGDIVQVVDRWRERIWTVIVHAPPISTIEWKKRFGAHESDGSDDCYLVLHIDHEGDMEKYGICPDESKPDIRYVDTHDHPKSYNVFPLTRPVPEAHKKRLREKLEEHITIGGYTVPVCQ